MCFFLTIKNSGYSQNISTTVKIHVLVFDVSTPDCKIQCCATFHMANYNVSTKKKYSQRNKLYGDLRQEKAQLTHNKNRIYPYPHGNHSHTPSFCFMGSYLRMLSTRQSYRFLSTNTTSLKSHSTQFSLNSPISLAKMFTTYLDNVAILDHRSQQLSVFSFILFLFQICGMLT